MEQSCGDSEFLSGISLVGFKCGRDFLFLTVNVCIWVVKMLLSRFNKGQGVSFCADL